MDTLSNNLPPAAASALNGTNSGSYLDFSNLGRLKGQAAKDGKSAARETAQQFEALFLQMMMKSMRDASFKSDLVESQAKDTFEGMFDKEVSLAMAKKNSLGLADMLIKNMPDPAVQAANAKAIQDLQAQQSGSTASFLQARANAGKGIPLAPAEVTPLSLRQADQPPLPLPRVGGAMPLSAAQRPVVKVDASDGGATP